MNALPETNLDRLRAWLRQCPWVAVAYSGGVDSSLLLQVAHEELGGRCLALLADSPSLPAAEREDALLLAHEMGAAVRVVPTLETAVPDYQANAPNRCFHCKNTVYAELVEETQRFHPDAILLDGMNAEDTLDVRPGRAAALRHGVRSPLYELGFDKETVRAAARHLGLRVWDKPAAACLASRVAYGLPVTDALLRRIESAEAYLKAQGLNEVRVRHHGEIARIEVPAEMLSLTLENASAWSAQLKSLGWLYVTLDLDGLRHGSMNAPLLKA